MGYFKKGTVLFLFLLLLGCPSGPERRPQTTEIPRPGEWSKLVLNPSIRSRMVFLKGLFESSSFKFNPTFRAEMSSQLSYEEYQDILQYPSSAKEAVEKHFAKLGLKNLSSAVPDLTSEHWTDLEILFQDIQIVEALSKVIWIHYKLRDPREPWKYYESSLRMGLAFLWKIEKDPYLKWLIGKLYKVLKKAEKDLGELKIPTLDKEKEAWLNVNFPKILKEDSKKALHLLIHQRNALFYAGEITWEEEMARFKQSREKISSRIHLLPASSLEIRTLYTNQEPQLMDTPQGRRFRGIGWIVTDSQGEGLYFSDFENIYRLEKGGRAQVIIEGSRGFFNPNIFVLDSYNYLSFIDPPYLREINLEKRTLRNYSFALAIPELKKHSFLARFPFTIDKSGNIYFADNEKKVIFQLRPNSLTKNLEIQGRFPFEGSISSLQHSQDSLYLTNYDLHLVQRLNLPLKEWTVMAGEKYMAGHWDGKKEDSLVNFPFSLVLQGSNILLSDESNHSIRKIRGGRIATLVGIHRGNQDGPLNKGTLNLPGPLALGKGGIVFFAGQGTGALRTIAPSNWIYQGASLPIFKDISRDLDKAKGYMEDKKNQEASQILSEAIKVAPLGLSLYRALKMRGTILKKEGFYPKAIEDFSRCISLNPHLSESYLLRGEAYLASQNVKQARGDFEKVISQKKFLPLQKKCTDPVYLKARLENMHSYFLQGNAEEALRLASNLFSFLKSARTAFNASTDNWEILTLTKRAEYYQSTGNPAKALEDYTYLGNLNPKKIDWLWKKANLYMKINKPRKSEEICKEILNLNSTFAKAHELLGNLYYKHIANDDKALLHYQYYLELKGKNSSAVQEKLKAILAEKKSRGSNYTDILIEKDGKKIKIRYYSDGRVERIPVF